MISPMRSGTRAGALDPLTSGAIAAAGRPAQRTGIGRVMRLDGATRVLERLSGPRPVPATRGEHFGLEQR